MPEVIEKQTFVRTLAPKSYRMKEAILNPLLASREINNRSLYEFLQYFWHLVSPHDFQPNWHIEFLCRELELLAKDVAARKPRKHDLIINVPPGSTKTITCSIMFPVWCWTQWYWMRFITASYSATLSLEAAEYSRDLVRSPEFQKLYPEIDIKQDKDVKSNFKIVKKITRSPGRPSQILVGGSRFSTSVGGSLTGFHGDILVVDDPLNPEQSASETELIKANRWCSQTLSTRKTNKSVTPTVMIMQRLHQDDPSGHMLAKLKTNIRHICLPGEARNYKDQVKPAELYKYYKNDLLDPKRMTWPVLADMEADLGQYGFAGQVGQLPVPPGGGMFKVDHFSMMSAMPSANHISSTVRYWDKAATKEGKGSFTAGVKISRLTNGMFVVEDVKRGRWDTHERERIIKETAIADGPKTDIWIEQEPGPIWEEELIQMSDGNRKKLKNIVIGDFIINGKGKPTKVLQVHKQGLLDILEITMDSGRVIHTAFDHLFLTPKGWLTAEKLCLEDVVALRVNIKTNPTSIPTIEECRLAGYYVGDGCCTTSKHSINSLVVSSDPEEGKDIIYCGESIGAKVNIGGSKKWTYYMSCGIKKWLREKGLAGKRTGNKVIPDWVKLANNECIANFIGAYFACDGSTYRRGNDISVEFYSISKRLLEDTQSLLLRFGIHSRLRQRMFKPESTTARHLIYRLVLRKGDDSIGKFANKIPVYGKKGQLLKKIEQRQFDKFYMDDKIINIMPCEKLLCRCLTVAEGESFLVNDIVVHNSSGKDSALGTIRNLAGFKAYKEPATGDKVDRADPFSVQVNNGNVSLLTALWNREFIEEYRFFPVGTYKDQVDAGSGAFTKVLGKKMARCISR